MATDKNIEHITWFGRRGGGGIAEVTRRAGRLLPTAPTPREVSRLTPRGQLHRSKGDVTQRSVVTSYVARRQPLNTYRLAAGRLNYHLCCDQIASHTVNRVSLLFIFHFELTIAVYRALCRRSAAGSKKLYRQSRLSSSIQVKAHGWAALPAGRRRAADRPGETGRTEPEADT